MPEIVIPKDRDTLADQAIGILEKRKTLGPQQGVKLVPADVKDLAVARKLKPKLKRYANLTEDMKNLTDEIEPLLPPVTRDLRNAGQSILRQTGYDIEKAKPWGLTFKQGRRKKGGTSPGARGGPRGR